MKKSLVYFMTNKKYTVIYVGVTSALVKRVAIMSKATLVLLKNTF